MRFPRFFSSVNWTLLCAILLLLLPSYTLALHTPYHTIPYRPNQNTYQKRKRKKRPCSQCKASSTPAWNPSRRTRTTPSTPAPRPSPSSARATSSTGASSATVRARRAWTSGRTAIAGRARSASARTARARTRRRSCAICRVRRWRRRRRRRRGGSGGRCEYYPSLSLFVPLPLFCLSSQLWNESGMMLTVCTERTTSMRPAEMPRARRIRPCPVRSSPAPSLQPQYPCPSSSPRPTPGASPLPKKRTARQP